MFDEKDYEKRYAGEWRQIQLQVKNLVNGFCCFPNCKRRGYQAHHVAYKDDEGPLVFEQDGILINRAIPGIHAFWLCQIHHSKGHKDGAHHPRNYRQYKINPVENNHNTAEYYLLLRQGWTNLIKEKQNATSKIQSPQPRVSLNRSRRG